MRAKSAIWRLAGALAALAGALAARLAGALAAVFSLGRFFASNAPSAARRLGALAALLLTAGCGEVPHAKIGEKAPQISARNTANELVKLRENGLQIVQFWSNGCAACLKIMDDLEALALANGVQILAINSTDSAAVIAAHEREKAYAAIRFLRDNSQISAERYEIFAIPTMFIIQDGILREKILGERTFGYIAARLQGYLKR